jgi:hypothetical protein
MEQITSNSEDDIVKKESNSSGISSKRILKKTMLVNKEKPKKTTTLGSIPITNTNNYYIRLTKENLNITATARLTKRSCLDPSSHDNIYLNKYI